MKILIDCILLFYLIYLFIHSIIYNVHTKNVRNIFYIIDLLDLFHTCSCQISHTFPIQALFIFLIIKLGSPVTALL